MKKFGIYHSLDSYKSGNGKVGDIHVLLDNYAFPNDEWFDFGFYIISAWADSFTKLHNGEKRVECKFMDGNYRFDILKKDSQIWKFEFIAERQADEIWQSGKVYATQATEVLLDNINLIINKLEKEGESKKLEFWDEVKQKLFQVRKT